MRNLTKIERLNKSTSNLMELMEEILTIRMGGTEDFEYMKELINTIHNDQLELIEMVDKLENGEKDTVEVPSFITKKLP